MKDQYNNNIDSADLTKRLKRIQKSHSVPNDGDCTSPNHPQLCFTHANTNVDVSRLPRLGRTPSTTSSSTDQDTPSVAFSKSTTTTSTASDPVSRLHVLRSLPSTRSSKASAEVSQGEFSKPRVHERHRRDRRRVRSEHYSSGRDYTRRQSDSDAPQFQYYGRHANSWLFNDFSVTGAVRKGFGKVFGRDREDKE